jgi:hypothetical protein
VEKQEGNRPVGRPRSRRADIKLINGRKRMEAWTGLMLPRIGRGRRLL